jgi:predicted O-methyltransferase YrrM
MEVYQPARIIELGSYNGGFTIALAIHAWIIKAKVISYDVMEAPSVAFRELARFLGIEFVRADLFQRQQEIKTLIGQPGVTYLLCDNGNKPDEFNLFAEALKPGDVIGAHDFKCPGYWEYSEITTQQVDRAVTIYGLTPFLQSYFDCTGWLVYLKKRK